MPVEAKMTEAEKLVKYRDNLKDVLALAEGLIDIAPSTAELIEVIQPALESDAQLRLLVVAIGSAKR